MNCQSARTSDTLTCAPKGLSVLHIARIVSSNPRSCCVRALDCGSSLSTRGQSRQGLPSAIACESAACETFATLRRYRGGADASPEANTSNSGDEPTGANCPQAPLTLPKRLLPRHVAVIMDGNSRWALARGLQIRLGHEAGVAALRRVVRCCLVWQIPALTVFAFSAENWRRTDEEIGLLMALFQDVVSSELRALVKEGIRLRFIGDRLRLPLSMQRLMKRVELETAGGQNLHLTVALSYGGRQDMVQAVQRIGTEIADGRLQPSQVDEGLIGSCLGLSHLPGDLRQPDLLIRSSGERRLSNFLLWELAYSELHFTETQWPDFGEADLRAALTDFCARQRRYGRH